VHLLVIEYCFSMISLEETINEAYNYVEYQIVLWSEEYINDYSNKLSYIPGVNNVM